MLFFYFLCSCSSSPLFFFPFLFPACTWSQTYDSYLRQNEAALRNELEVPLIAYEYYENSVPPRKVRSMYDVIKHIRDDEMHHSGALGEYAVEACDRAAREGLLE